MFPKKCKKKKFWEQPLLFLDVIYHDSPTQVYCIVKIFYKERLALDKMIDEPWIEKKDTVFW